MVEICDWDLDVQEQTAQEQRNGQKGSYSALFCSVVFFPSTACIYEYQISHVLVFITGHCQYGYTSEPINATIQSPLKDSLQMLKIKY